MYKNVLVLIPARGGSRGVPGKNVKLLEGKPLIYYTVETAREIFNDDQILVSTDDPTIKSVVEATGLEVPFLRPEHLATDNSGMHEVMIHAVEFMEGMGKKTDILVLLQPTSPFRNSKHLREALNLYDPSFDMVTSVKETKSNPYYVLKEENAEGFLVPSKTGKFVRRQDCPKVWELNGAIYIINVERLKNQHIGKFKKIKKYVMDDFSSVDLDEEADWKLAEYYIKSTSAANSTAV
ncbi:acylneuraminate cytidylyltransferase family protein [Salinimicrobium sp. HB62]|uniref:acylneuraminate cytidylyltransferase family protein n=1 Tax=Salinimicrobium sp. HB62 TaxID=3077781 RepID=UPI002D79230B|nr:acylneuraminate cytidylyltransferase family protein [Salinimicrobium sp. HB62]